MRTARHIQCLFIPILWLGKLRQTCGSIGLKGQGAEVEAVSCPFRTLSVLPAGATVLASPLPGPPPGLQCPPQRALQTAPDGATVVGGPALLFARWQDTYQ